MKIRSSSACWFLAISIGFSLKATGQPMERIVFDARDSVNDYYLAFRPASGTIKGTLLLINSFFPPERLLPDTRLHSVGYANDLLTVYASMGKKVDADSATVSRLNAIFNNVKSTYGIDNDHTVLAGYDFAGGIALRYTELSIQQPQSCNLHPKAVFAVDAPVDLFTFWHQWERQIQKNFYPGTVGDAKFLLDLMKRENGALPDNPGRYSFLTPFHAELPGVGNEQYLASLPVRLYYDVDVEWQLANRRNSLFDTNIPDGSELINRLLLQGNQRAEFISAKRPGVRSNGQRNPNTLSIVDEVECIQWIKSALNIFDPLTFKPPYVFPVPDRWPTERFALPPDFAPSLTFKGVEEVRFHPGWGDSTSEGYWSYIYLWWLDGTPAIDEAALQQNLQALYSGLVARNITRRNIPKDKQVPTIASVKKIKTTQGDLNTFSATVKMLDYMTQRPITLNLMIHQMDPRTSQKSVIIIEVSPQPSGHPTWKQLDDIQNGFTPQR